MERGELVSYAYAMYAAGAKADAENAKLRGARDVWQENDAKLRELVRAAWRCIHTGASCYDCRLIAGRCTLQTAMRKLGIEEDE
jgi:hypothetical protein